jgi:hypothetical protein
VEGGVVPSFRVWAGAPAGGVAILRAKKWIPMNRPFAIDSNIHTYVYCHRCLRPSRASPIRSNDRRVPAGSRRQLGVQRSRAQLPADTAAAGAAMKAFLPEAGAGEKITAKFKSKLFSFAHVVVDDNALTLYQIAEPLGTTSSATAENPAPFGTDLQGQPVNDPIPDTVFDPDTRTVVSYLRRERPPFSTRSRLPNRTSLRTPMRV